MMTAKGGIMSRMMIELPEESVCQNSRHFSSFPAKEMRAFRYNRCPLFP